MFSSKTIVVLVDYNSYNYVNDLKDSNKLPFRILYILFEKQLEVLRKYHKSII